MGRIPKHISGHTTMLCFFESNLEELKRTATGDNSFRQL